MPRRSSRPHVCCCCGKEAPRRLCFSIDKQAVAVLWLCQDHAWRVMQDRWSIQLESDWGGSWISPKWR